MANEFRILGDMDTNRLADAVNAARAEGWCPNGGLFYYNARFNQQMMKGPCDVPYFIVNAADGTTFRQDVNRCIEAFSPEAVGLGEVMAVNSYFIQAFGCEVDTTHGHGGGSGPGDLGRFYKEFETDGMVCPMIIPDDNLPYLLVDSNDQGMGMIAITKRTGGPDQLQASVLIAGSSADGSEYWQITGDAGTGSLGSNLRYFHMSAPGHSAYAFLGDIAGDGNTSVILQREGVDVFTAESYQTAIRHGDGDMITISDDLANILINNASVFHSDGQYTNVIGWGSHLSLTPTGISLGGTGGNLQLHETNGISLSDNIGNEILASVPSGTRLSSPGGDNLNLTSASGTASQLTTIGNFNMRSLGQLCYEARPDSTSIYHTQNGVTSGLTVKATATTILNGMSSAGLVINSSGGWSQAMNPATGYQVNNNGTVAFLIKDNTTPTNSLTYLNAIGDQGIALSYKGNQVLLADAAATTLAFTNGASLGLNATAAELNLTDSKFHVSTGGSVTLSTSTDGVTPNVWLAQYTSGSNHTTAPGPTDPKQQYLVIGGREWGANSVKGIGFGYDRAVTNWAPVFIGYRETNVTDNNYGDLFFATRNVTTNTQPTERLRITSTGQITAAENYIPLTNPDLATKKYVDDAVASGVGGTTVGSYNAADTAVTLTPGKNVYYSSAATATAGVTIYAPTAGLTDFSVMAPSHSGVIINAPVGCLLRMGATTAGAVSIPGGTFVRFIALSATEWLTMTSFTVEGLNG